MKTILIQRRLLAIDPWAAAGPGWANSGVTAFFEDMDKEGKVRVTRETVYSKDLDQAESLAWKTAMAANEVLRRRFEKMEVKA